MRTFYTPVIDTTNTSRRSEHPQRFTRPLKCCRKFAAMIRRLTRRYRLSLMRNSISYLDHAAARLVSVFRGRRDVREADVVGALLVPDDVADLDEQVGIGEILWNLIRRQGFHDRLREPDVLDVLVLRRRPPGREENRKRDTSGKKHETPSGMCSLSPSLPHYSLITLVSPPLNISQTE